MNWQDIALELIKKNEGCKLEAYPDPISGTSPWTIGWGATGPDIQPGVVWTQAQADEDLESRVEVLGKQIDAKFVNVEFSAGQKGSLIDFAYNLGFAALANSTLAKDILAGDFTSAQAQFPLWDHANGREIPALATRREEELEDFENTNLA